MAATFPGGVKVFTTKQAGDQIASAHINDLQAEVVAVETELRKTTGSVVSHGSLAGLNNNDHPQYVLMSGNQTVAGTKTFSTIPVLPSSDPTSDNQAARKAYADKMKPAYVLMPSLSDDSVYSFTPSNAQGFILWRKAAGADGGALVAYDAVSTPYTVLIAGTPIMAVRTGALTGTTGTDGKITISAASDGKIYIENRYGSTIYSAYVCL